MAMRAFDPAALERYRQFLAGLLEELENEIIPTLSDGDLKKAPAFGTAPGAAENATVEYADFHATTWRNLQYLRGTLHGLIAGLQTAIDTGGTADQQTATDMTRMAEGDDLYA
ncbi:hypothetical protein O1R50_18800 [Glycomyces luteolus]|uniref:Uncharacterized protein n=1 Tax=Glycomyces luteolus TaxID=2670330 RepID=A0A9X3PFK1_9ACTN|nr:hypothetical protein [Glycomyces luteolus]MDA1361684.1 hypothetical protein [Glycomyces luteolus]